MSARRRSIRYRQATDDLSENSQQGISLPERRESLPPRIRQHHINNSNTRRRFEALRQMRMTNLSTSETEVGVNLPSGNRMPNYRRAINELFTQFRNHTPSNEIENILRSALSSSLNITGMIQTNHGPILNQVMMLLNDVDLALLVSKIKSKIRQNQRFSLRVFQNIKSVQRLCRSRILKIYPNQNI